MVWTISQVSIQKFGFYQIYANYSIFVINDIVCSLIITIFIHNLNISALYESKILLKIKKDLAAMFDKIDIVFLVFYIILKVTPD